MTRRKRRQSRQDRPTSVPPTTVTGPALAGPAREPPDRRRPKGKDDFSRSGLRSAIVLTVVLKLAGIVLLIDPDGLQVFDFPKTLFSHATDWLIIALLLLVFARFGRRAFPRGPFLLLPTGVALAAVVSALFADNTYVALYGENDRYLGLTFLADAAVTYIAIIVAFRNTRDFATLGLGLAAALLGAAGYAVLQFAGRDPLRWAEFSSQERPFSTMGNPDMFASFLSTMLVGCAAVAALAGGRAQRPLRIAALSFMVMALVVSVFVATRGSLIGIAGGLPAVAACYLRVRGARAIRRRAAIVGAAVAITALAGVIAFTPLGGRLRATLAGEAVADRVLIWDSALHAIAERPVLGFGPDNFAVAYRHYRQPGSAEVFGYRVSQTSAHDWVLQTAATTGLVGLAAMLALIGWTVNALWRRGLRTAPMVAAPVLAGLAAFYAEGLVTPNGASIDWIPWLAFAVTPALLVDRVRVDQSRRIANPILAMAMLPAVILAWTGSSAFEANRDAVIARNATNAKDKTVSVAAALSATRLDPGRPEHWLRLGLAFELAEAWRPAGDAYAEAAARQPYDATNWSNLAAARTNQVLRHDESSGGEIAALAAAQRGVDVDPNNPAPYRVYADVAYFLGRYDLALKEIVSAIKLYRLDATFDKRAADASARASDKTAARAELGDALRSKDTAALRVAAAQLALDQHDAVAAAAHARRALELEPTNSDAQRILAAATSG